MTAPISDPDFWKNKIRAFFHDPPDKAIKIPSHENRRNEILGALSFKKKSSVGKQISEADRSAASLQRIDLESTPDGKKLSSQFYEVHDEEHILIGEPVLRHPLTGDVKEHTLLSCILPSLNESSEGDYKQQFGSVLSEIVEAEKRAFSKLVRKGGTKADYFRLWQLYEDTLKKELVERFKEVKLGGGLNKNCYGELANEITSLTAYTLSPDHTLFDHADATSAIYGASARGDNPEDARCALLMFKLSPVQDFIASARKERDLWAGSHLVSFLTFQAMRAIIDIYGPDAIVFPHLRRQPLFDKSYERYWDEDMNHADKALKVASIPNKFLAIVSQNDLENESNGLNIAQRLEVAHALMERLHSRDFDFAQWLKDGISIRRTAQAAVDATLLDVFDYAWQELIDGIQSGCLPDRDEMERSLLSHFSITLKSIPEPFSSPELDNDRKESYRKLKELVDQLNLPQKTREKYMQWLNLLSSPPVHWARPFDLYGLMFEMLEQLVGIESRKFEKPKESGYKCTLCGEHAAVCANSYNAMRSFWHEIFTKTKDKYPLLIKKNERLCPLCIVKRMYPYWLKEHGYGGVGFESVSEVALKRGEWLEKVERSEKYDELVHLVQKIENQKGTLIRDGKLTDPELLYIESWTRKYLEDVFEIKIEDEKLKPIKKKLEEIYDEKKYGEPEKYYAILMMDGDNMGRTLGGDEMRPVSGYLHPELRAHLPHKRHMIENTNRLLTPAAHAAISRALMHFSVEKAGEIVNEHRGTLIYAGGDDVLALLPVDTAMSAAHELEKTFAIGWDGWKVMPAKTMSAGLLIVHYKHPLYDALDKTRDLERKAKQSGRNALAMGQLKRSGTYRQVIFGWDAIERMEHILKLFRNAQQNEEQRTGAALSTRMVYHALQQINSLPDEEGAMNAYVRYLLLTHYTPASNDEKEIEVDVLSREFMALARTFRDDGLRDQLHSMFLLMKMLTDREAER